MPKILSPRERAQEVNSLSRTITRILSFDHVLIERIACPSRTGSLLSNIAYCNKNEKSPLVYISFGGLSPGNSTFDIAYSREASKQILYPEKIRILAELIPSVHRAAVNCSPNLQATIDDGMVSGKGPALSFGGNFPRENLEDVLRLIASANDLTYLAFKKK